MKNVIIAAGGTGGHINAALSLGEELTKKGYRVHYFSGRRHLDYKLFNGMNVYHLDARPLRVKSPIKLAVNITLNIYLFISLFIKMIKLNPTFVIGCGGYVCGPVLLSAYLCFKNIFVLEQNAIAGLTNRLLSNISDLNFVSYERTVGIDRKVVISGNPVRSKIKTMEIIEPAENINILVFGGSLGATQINEAISFLITQKLPGVYIRHQVGKNNKTNEISKNYEQFEFLENIENDYQWANIIISRAGASTISELEIVQKPCLLIPYPSAVDNHQYYNAKALEAKSGFYVSVLDHKKDSIKLADDIKREIEKIKNENLYIPKKNVNNVSATKVIIEEIEKYVRT